MTGVQIVKCCTSTVFKGMGVTDCAAVRVDNNSLKLVPRH